jgi:hypothetical protein
LRGLLLKNSPVKLCCCICVPAKKQTSDPALATTEDPFAKSLLSGSLCAYMRTAAFFFLATFMDLAKNNSQNG